MKKIRKNEHYIIIIIGLIIVAYDYLNYDSISESYGALLIVLGLIIMFGKYIWKKNNSKS